MTDSKDKTLLPPSSSRFLKSKALWASGHSAGQSHLLAHLGVEDQEDSGVFSTHIQNIWAASAPTCYSSFLPSLKSEPVRHSESGGEGRPPGSRLAQGRRAGSRAGPSARPH